MVKRDQDVVGSVASFSLDEPSRHDSQRLPPAEHDANSMRLAGGVGIKDEAGRRKCEVLHVRAELPLELRFHIMLGERGTNPFEHRRLETSDIKHGDRHC